MRVWGFLCAGWGVESMADGRGKPVAAPRIYARAYYFYDLLTVILPPIRWVGCTGRLVYHHNISIFRHLKYDASGARMFNELASTTEKVIMRSRRRPLNEQPTCPETLKASERFMNICWENPRIGTHQSIWNVSVRLIFALLPSFHLLDIRRILGDCAKAYEEAQHWPPRLHEHITITPGMLASELVVFSPRHGRNLFSTEPVRSMDEIDSCAGQLRDIAMKKRKRSR